MSSPSDPNGISGSLTLDPVSEMAAGETSNQPGSHDFIVAIFTRAWDKMKAAGLKDALAGRRLRVSWTTDDVLLDEAGFETGFEKLLSGIGQTIAETRGAALEVMEGGVRLTGQIS